MTPEQRSQALVAFRAEHAEASDVWWRLREHAEQLSPPAPQAVDAPASPADAYLEQDHVDVDAIEDSETPED